MTTTITPHPYAEILHAIADGHQIQRQDPTGRWIDQEPSQTLYEIGSAQYAPKRYRIKPRTITINGHEVPEPLRAMPPEGTEVFWPEFGVSSDENWVSSDKASSLHPVMLDLLRIGMLHPTHEAAQAHAMALLSFSEQEES